MLEPGDELGRLVGRALGRTLDELGRYPELREGAGTVRTPPELGAGDEREGEDERWKLGVERLLLLGRKELPLERENPPLEREGLLVRELDPEDPREPRWAHPSVPETRSKAIVPNRGRRRVFMVGAGVESAASAGTRKSDAWPGEPWMAPPPGESPFQGTPYEGQARSVG